MESMTKEVTIIGGGLAGSEAAWQLVKRGIPVKIYEMRPQTKTKAHKTGLFAELVCSNSLRGAALSNAVGLLKHELSLCDSLIMEAAKVAEVPAGGALAVDRDVFSAHIDKTLRNHPLVTVVEEELTSLPETRPLIVATGPLTSRALTQSIEKLTGSDNLAFFDAISPIFFSESIDHSIVFRQSRYDKGEGDDYLNIPLSEAEYYQFIDDVLAADKYTGNEDVENDSLDKLRPFEGCMPIEDMAERGRDTPRFGPLKPKGLTDPRTGERPFAVMQLRQDDKAGTLWSLVGMQTRMKRADQERVFRSLPGLAKADFVRFGSVHRNTFIESPKCLNRTLEFQGNPGLFFAGQITGVEGYVESTAGGLVAGLNAARFVNATTLAEFPIETATGALMAYISDGARRDFQPMNVSFGLMPSYASSPRRDANRKRLSKRDRRESVSRKALEVLEEWLETNGEAVAGSLQAS